MSERVCIVYGLNEGPTMGKPLVSVCEKAGFEIVDNPAEADLIFAHSGGCLLIPPDNRAKAIVMVGLPFWPGRPWIVSTLVKIWREGRSYHHNHRLKQWLIKWTHHFRYAAGLKSGWRMAVNRAFDKPWNADRHEIILRNHYDAYCTPNVHRLPFNGPRTFISLPGGHDDCWDNPKPYLRLLQLLAQGEERAHEGSTPK